MQNLHKNYLICRNKILFNILKLKNIKLILTNNQTFYILFYVF